MAGVLKNILVITKNDKDDLDKSSFGFSFEDYNIIFENKINNVFDILNNNKIEVIVIDYNADNNLMFEIIKNARVENQIPIVMLCDKGNLSDMISELYLYIEDFILKPFDKSEFEARITTAIKKNRIKNSAENEIHTIGNLKVDTARHFVSYNREEVMLTKTEYELLLFLTINKNIVMTRNDILNNVWGLDYSGETNIVDVYIRYLRKKIDKKYNDNIIKTLRGVGYFVTD